MLTIKEKAFVEKVGAEYRKLCRKHPDKIVWLGSNEDLWQSKSGWIDVPNDDFTIAQKELSRVKHKYNFNLVLSNVLIDNTDLPGQPSVIISTANPKEDVLT